MSTGAIAEISVCETCLHWHANREDIRESNADPEPWGELPNAHVGMDYCADHFERDGGPCEQCEGSYNGIDDGYSAFSSVPCTACGSRLAGSRFRFAVWTWDGGDDK